MWPCSFKLVSVPRSKNKISFQEWIIFVPGINKHEGMCRRSFGKRQHKKPRPENFATLNKIQRIQQILYVWTNCYLAKPASGFSEVSIPLHVPAEKMSRCLQQLISFHNYWEVISGLQKSIKIKKNIPVCWYGTKCWYGYQPCSRIILPVTELYFFFCKKDHPGNLQCLGESCKWLHAFHQGCGENSKKTTLWRWLLGQVILHQNKCECGHNFDIHKVRLSSLSWME